MIECKLGISTWVWTSPFSSKTIDLFPKIKAMGYDVVEIPVEYPEMISSSEVKKALLDNGLDGIVCGAFGPDRDFTHIDQNIHKNCRDYIYRCFDLCEEWGSTFLAGPMYSSVGNVRMLPPDGRAEEWKRAVGNLQIVCEEAGRRNLSIALEPLNRFESDMVNTAADVLRMVQDIDHPSAKIMLDTFHMNIEETDLSTAIESVQEHLIHFQVSDSHRGIPGTGLAPWSSIKHGLINAHYSGVVSIESFTPEIKELAGAVCIWRTFAESQDQFAEQGYSFLNQLFQSK